MRYDVHVPFHFLRCIHRALVVLSTKRWTLIQPKKKTKKTEQIQEKQSQKIVHTSVNSDLTEKL